MNDGGARGELAEPVMKILEEDDILQDAFERLNYVRRVMSGLEVSRCIVNRFMHKRIARVVEPLT